MKPRGNELSYLRAAVEGASSVELVIMLYDRLITDLQRAMAAMRARDVEGRCAQIKHALLILQQLEGSMDAERGGDAARNLGAFYSHARAKIMEGQITGKPELLEKLIGHLAEVRTAWQQVDPAGSQRSSAGVPAQDNALQPVRGEEAILSCTV
jgi:flagellar secretion chaperone FliS